MGTLYCHPKNAPTARPPHKKASVSKASWAGVLDFLGSGSGMRISGVLFKTAFYPAPSVRPAPAPLKGDRFDDVIVRLSAMTEPNEIAAGTIKFFALRETDRMPLSSLGTVDAKAGMQR